MTARCNIIIIYVENIIFYIFIMLYIFLKMDDVRYDIIMICNITTPDNNYDVDDNLP